VPTAEEAERALEQLRDFVARTKPAPEPAVPVATTQPAPAGGA
jgi:hypothetical protein